MKEHYQMTFFDCDVTLREIDSLYQTLNNLKTDEMLKLDDFLITKSERFFTVSKDDEFEELFKCLELCYEFLNQKIDPNQK